MKLNKWLYGLTALAMLAACSDKDVAPGGEDNGGNTSSESVSYLGISLELPSESVTRADGDTSTPPSDVKDVGNQGNDNYDDGTTTEYNVENAAILLFQGKTEAKAEFIGAYVLGSDESFDNPANDNITTSFQRTIQILQKPTISESDTQKKLWALALVNYKNEHFDISGDIDDAANYGKLTVKGTGTAGTTNVPINRKADVKAASGTEGEEGYEPAVKATTFAEFRIIATTCKFLNYRSGTTSTLKSIFMTNAPLADAIGTTAQPENATIQTLAILDHSKIFNTKVEAMKDPAGCIFVERAVAKVTCSEFPKSTTLKRAVVTEDGSVYQQDIVFNIKNVEWMIDNEEKTSYIVRNSQTDDPWWQWYSTNSKNSSTRYRFIGNANMSYQNYNDGNTTHKKWYRTYWCKDPKYSDNKDYNDLTQTSQYASFVTSGTKLASSSALYPHENTFDIDHQNYKNTTRVIFKVTYDKTVNLPEIKDDKDNVVAAAKTGHAATIYAIRGQLNDMYLTEDAQNILKRDVVASNGVKEAIKAALAPGKTFAEYSESDIEFTFGQAENADSENKIEKGDYVINGAKFKASAFYSDTNTSGFLDPDKRTALQDALDEAVTAANGANHLVKFSQDPNKDTFCYYVVYIQHFGDTYCMLPEGWKGTTTGEVYGLSTVAGNSEKYLGRYGMVRNNWYDIVVDKIGKLGSAEVPRGNVDTSDDNKKEQWFFSARIHVLSWARRTQHVDF